MQTHKTFVIRNDTGSDQRDNRRLEIRNLYSVSDPGDASDVDIRFYSTPGWNGTLGTGDAWVDQIANFKVQYETWTRYWVYVDMEPGAFKFWMNDDRSGTVKLFDTSFDSPPISGQGMQRVNFQLNTSQSTSVSVTNGGW